MMTTTSKLTKMTTIDNKTPNSNPKIEKKNKKKNFKNFDTYIKRVLKSVHPDAQITKFALDQLNDFAIVITKEICKTSVDRLIISNKETVTSREIQHSIRAILPGELCKHAVSEGTKAVTKYDARKCEKEINKDKKKTSIPTRKCSIAGVIMPIPRFEKYFRHYFTRIGEGGPIYCAAVVEYLLAEILELAGNATRDNRAIKIKSRHIFLAIENDEELHGLCNSLNIEFAKGGVLASIHEALIPFHDDNGKIVKKKKPKKEKKIIIQGVNDHGIRKPHRFLPGTVALRSIRKYQRTQELLTQKLPFERFVRKTAKEYHEDFRFSEGVLEQFQGFIELRIVKLFAEAQKIALLSKKISVEAKDIIKAKDILSKTLLMKMNTYHKSKGPFLKPGLKRLAQRGGIKRISKSSYFEMNGISGQIIEACISSLALEVEYLRQKTAKPNALKTALSSLGYNYMFSC